MQSHILPSADQPEEADWRASCIAEAVGLAPGPSARPALDSPAHPAPCFAFYSLNNRNRAPRHGPFFFLRPLRIVPLPLTMELLNGSSGKCKFCRASATCCILIIQLPRGTSARAAVKGTHRLGELGKVLADDRTRTV